MTENDATKNWDEYKKSLLELKLYYDPFSLFFEKSINTNFIFSGEDIIDTELFKVGRDAIELLGVDQKDKFINGLSAFCEWDSVFRETLSERTDVKVGFVGFNGEKETVAIKDLESDSLLSVAWEFFERVKQEKYVDIEDFDSNHVFFQLSLFQVFYSIQDCMFAIKAGDAHSSISYALRAARMLNNAQVIESKQESLINLRREISYNAAMARLRKDPKQKALSEIQKHYQEQKVNFKRRGYTAQFIRDMQSKYPIITDQKTIANLVARLNKTNEYIPR